MKNRAKLKNNNRGMGIVTIMVAIMFLTAFGSVILMLSYTAVEMRSSDRKGKENLYSASAVMDQVSVGLQDICSEAIESAYSASLVKYNYYGSNVTMDFQKSYGDYIKNCAYDTENGAWAKSKVGVDPQKVIRLISIDGNTYNVAVLDCLISDEIKNAEDISYKLTSSSGGIVTGFQNEDFFTVENYSKPDPIVFEGVTIEFTKDGRTTKITTDITIDYPSIGYSNNIYSDEGVNQNACIVRGGLIQNGGSMPSEIIGSAYFGYAELKGSSSMMFTKNYDDAEESRFIIAGDITLQDGGVNSLQRFNLGETSELWTDNIILKTGGTVSLKGTTYIADDLELAGNDTKAYVGGTYYGFGNNNDGHENSSAIVVNGQNTTLDLSEVNSLTLAGVSYVNDYDYPMGQSMAVKRDQNAYLIPFNALSYNYSYVDSDGKTHSGNAVPLRSNPQAINKNIVLGITGWNLKPEELWPDSRKTVYNYDIEPKMIVQRYAGSDEYMVCVFAEFVGENAEQNRNAFFKDYFTYNTQDISKYVEAYVDLVGGNSTNRTIGNTYYEVVRDNGKTDLKRSEYLNADQATTLKAEAKATADIYDSYKANLGQSNDYDSDDNPLSYVLSEDVEKIDGYIEYQVENNGSPLTVAIATNKDVEITVENNTPIIKIDGVRVASADPNQVKLIITTGNLKINNGTSGSQVFYDGLLIVGGNLEMRNAVLNRNPQSVTAALTAKSTNGSSVTEFLENENSEEEKVAEGWAVTELVGYDNWSRTNEDD